MIKIVSDSSTLYSIKDGQANNVDIAPLTVSINNKIYREYEDINTKDYILHLKDRFELYHKTPHEVGVFLGYPLNDVKDFIKYKGNNFKICGCWKVYNDVELCSNKFETFKKYTQLFTYLYDNNYPLETFVHNGIKF